MAAWLWWAWLQIWPNLAANVLWVPAAWAHHVLMRRQAERHREELTAHVTAALGGAHTEEV